MGRPVGVISKSDLVRYESQPDASVTGRQTADQWMTPSIYRVTASTSVPAAARRMVRYGTHHIFVSGNMPDRLAGIVSSFDVLRAVPRSAISGLDLVASELDKTVGPVAGAIYWDLARPFVEPPLMLLPPLTYKLRKVPEKFSSVHLLSLEQRRLIAEEIRVAIVPMLFAYGVEAERINRVAPLIEHAALQALFTE